MSESNFKTRQADPPIRQDEPCPTDQAHTTESDTAVEFDPASPLTGEQTALDNREQATLLATAGAVIAFFCVAYWTSLASESAGVRDPETDDEPGPTAIRISQNISLDGHDTEEHI